jgi:sugar O-acyltransferase (sialic acid O-acetyltransferase NeuD family)
MKNEKLLILGFGGHARSVADVAFSCGYKEFLFVDQNAAENETFLGHPVVRDFGSIDKSWAEAFPASGDANQRLRYYETALAKGMRLVNLISPRASIGLGVTINPGSIVGHHAHIGPMAVIGRGCIINTGAIVEHECMIGEFAHISVNSVIAGRSSLGSFSMLGAGATIIDGVSVSDRVIIGAGAVVAHSINSAGTYMGIPARRRQSTL